MNNRTRYREINVSGSPRELGRQIGEAAREETRGFCEVALERVNKTVSVSRERAFDIARRSTAFAEKYRPDLVEELRRTAESAGVTLDELMLLQVRNQFTPEEGGCTSLALQPSLPTGWGLTTNGTGLYAKQRNRGFASCNQRNRGRQLPRPELAALHGLKFFDTASVDGGSLCA